MNFLLHNPLFLRLFEILFNMKIISLGNRIITILYFNQSPITHFRIDFVIKNLYPDIIFLSYLEDEISIIDWIFIIENIITFDKLFPGWIILRFFVVMHAD